MRGVVTVVWVALAVAGCSRYGFEGAASSDAGLDGVVIVDSVVDSVVDSGVVGPPDTWPSDVGEPIDAPTDGPVFAGLTVGALQQAWSLPHSVRFGWTCAGSVPNSAQFELCVGRDAAELQSATRCVKPSDDAVLELRACGSRSELGTTVYGLTPGQRLLAQVRVVEPVAGGRVSRYTPLLLTLPKEGQTSTWLFREAGSAVPTNGTRVVEVGAYAGVHALQLELAAGDLSSLGVRELSLPNVSTSTFGGAYVELFVDTTAAVRATLTVVGTAGEYHYEGIALDGVLGYQRVQVPLSKLLHEVSNAPLDAASLATVHTLRLGAPWPQAGSTRADEVRIVW